MAEVTTVKIKYGKLEATFELIYRWYVSGDDYWELLTGMHIIPYGGFWNDYSYGNPEDRTLRNKNHDWAFKLKNFDRKKVGSKGDGVFYGFGAWYNIPKYADIQWEIIGFE
jgi:hypothetical protein